MKIKEIANFFHENNFQVFDIINRGKKQGLTEPQILKGMEVVYNRVQSGEQIKKIQLVWQVWAEAKKSRGKRYRDWIKTREQYLDEISQLKRRYRDLAITTGTGLTLIIISLIWCYYV